MSLRTLTLMAAGALTLAGCATTSPYNGYGGSGGGYSSATSSRSCADCGIVTRIESVSSNRGAPAGTGAVLGGQPSIWSVCRCQKGWGAGASVRWWR